MPFWVVYLQREHLLKKYTTMRRLLLLIVATAIVATGVVVCLNLWHDNKTLRNNQHALIEGVTLYRTKADKYAASVEALTLELDEFKHTHEEDAQQIRELGIRLRRVESHSKSITNTMLSDTIVIRDTVIMRDSMKYGVNITPWTTIQAAIMRDTLIYNIESVDTLHQIIHRVPRKFWFIRYGTKAIRQEVWSSNPNTKLIYTEYIVLRK